MTQRGAEKGSVVNCFQIRNFVTSNNIAVWVLGLTLVVSCFQIRNFVTSNNLKNLVNDVGNVVSCFQIRNFVTSNNKTKPIRRITML